MRPRRRQYTTTGVEVRPPAGIQAFAANPHNLVPSYIYSGHDERPTRWHGPQNWGLIDVRRLVACGEACRSKTADCFRENNGDKENLDAPLSSLGRGR